MSLLSTKRWSVGLSPHRVTLAQQGAFSAVKLVGSAVPSRPDWTAALATLEELLPANASGQLRVVVSSHWLRYQLLPWNDLLARRRDAQNVARAHFAQVYGTSVSLGRVTLADQGWGKPVLACAIPEELEALIETNAIRYGMKLEALVPDLHLLDYLRPSTHKGSHAVLLGQPGLWILLAGENGTTASVRHHRFAGDPIAAADQLIRQEALRLGLVEGFGRVDWLYPEDNRLIPGREFPAPTYLPRLPTRRGFSPATQGAFTFAVLGG